MNIKIELNDSSNDRLKDVAQVYIDSGAGETYDEAFSRILNSKNIGKSDYERIKKVKSALETGVITREKKPIESGRKLSKAEVLRLYKLIEAKEQENILIKMKEDMPSNYICVNSQEKLEAMLTDLAKNSHLTIDVETTGTDVWSDNIVGYVMSSIESDTHYYIPTRHETDEFQLDHELVRDSLKPLFENKNISKSGHNIGFDIQMLYNDGINVRGQLFDTQEAMKLLNENEESFALKTLASKYLNMPSKTYGQLFGKKGFHEVSDLAIATAYAAKDGDITYKLKEFQEKHLKKSFPEIYKYFMTVEMPLIYVICDMERTGMVIDTDRAKEYGEEINQEMDRLQKSIEDVLGEINLNSPKQLKESLEEHTKRKLEDTNANKTLKPLAKDFPVVKSILRYKELAKLYGTYVETLPTAVKESTGKLMPQYNQNGAKTGRFSSSGGVNLQNQSDESRQLFVAPKGKVLVGADFKAQEIRCVAYLSQEPVLVNAFIDGVDPYANMASRFYNKPYEEVYKNADGSDTKERKEMKVVWLATLYGMSIYSLADMLGVSKEEAERFQEELFDSMPKLKKWIDDTKNFVQKNGYVEMDKGQRRRRLPAAKNKKFNIPYGKYYSNEYKEAREHNSEINRSLRQAPNAVVQGSSSVQTKVTLIEMYKLCKRKKGWKLWNTVHDEIIIEIPEDFTKEDVNDIYKVMVGSYKWGDKVPNGTDIEVMTRWSDPVSVFDWFK